MHNPTQQDRDAKTLNTPEIRYSTTKAPKRTINNKGYPDIIAT
jgi:hypothetical protein